MAKKVLQTHDYLEKQLQEQIKFMESSAKSFDEGQESEAKRLATQLRVLLHDTSNSKSLLSQLGVKNTLQFYSSINKREGLRLGPLTGLILKSLGPNGGKYVAPLDDFPPDHEFRKIGFDEYWVEPVLTDNRGRSFNRKDLVLTVANQDGGTHVDPGLDEDYVELTQKNSLGWVSGTGGEKGQPLTGEVLASIRQIGHEVLKTLIPDYPVKKLLNRQGSAVLGDIHLSKGFSPGFLVNGPSSSNAQAARPKVGRNDPCPCGSEKKYKKCHGKA
jgi:hypothetical protein